MRASPLLLLVAAIGLAQVSLNACASVGAHDKCMPPASDSMYRAFMPVYRACAVDRTAKATSQPFPDWRPTVTSPADGGRCYSADLEFVVDTTGKTIPASVRVLRTNTPDLADAYAAKLHTWQFDPAVIA